MEKLAKMAMLDISDVQKVWKDIGKMLEAAEILKEIDAVDKLPKGTGILRPDEVEASDSKGGYIIVPKVVGE